MPLADTISVAQLSERLATERMPIVLDVRRADVFDTSEDVVPLSRRENHLTLVADAYRAAREGVVCVCRHGHNVSWLATASLRASGVPAAVLVGGIAAWREAGLPTIARAPDAAGRFGAGTVWVTRRRPKIDRIACPWFIRRFVDARARILYVDPDQVLPIAAEIDGAVAFDVEGAPVTHDGRRCSFDTLLDRYAVNDPTLRRVADIVRAADTGDLAAAPEAAGLLAVSLGASHAEPDDLVMLDRLMPVYDALYRHLRFTCNETHTWPPRA